MVHIDELVTPVDTAVPSILTMFYPGQEAGDALMATLLGERSPAGKLPYALRSILANTPREEPQQLQAKIPQAFCTLECCTEMLPGAGIPGTAEALSKSEASSGVRADVASFL